MLSFSCSLPSLTGLAISRHGWGKLGHKRTGERPNSPSCHGKTPGPEKEEELSRLEHAGAADEHNTRNAGLERDTGRQTRRQKHKINEQTKPGVIRACADAQTLGWSTIHRNPCTYIYPFTNNGQQFGLILGSAFEIWAWIIISFSFLE